MLVLKKTHNVFILDAFKRKTKHVNRFLNNAFNFNRNQAFSAHF